MRNYLLIIFCGAVVAACGRASTAAAPAFSGARAMERVADQLSFGPRPPGSEALVQTRGWIQSSLEQAGWQVRRQAFVYRETELVNLIGYGEGEGPLIVLGAHYDTRPVADQDPSDPSGPVLGANDGASGVAVLLELARVLEPADLSCQLELAFFDGEDSGGLNGWDWIVGSTHYADHLQNAPSAVVIVDMVGDQSLQLPRELNSDPELQSEIWKAAADLGFQDAFLDQDGYSMMDDHTPFLQKGWPAVDIIDFDYPAWHTRQDVLDRVSADSLRTVGRTLQSWLTGRCP